VYLRAGQWDLAIADFNPKLASSLYGRGVAKQRKGDSAGAKTDIAAAQAINQNIADFCCRRELKGTCRAQEASLLNWFGRDTNHRRRAGRK
jgi:hypothetical protein